MPSVKNSDNQFANNIKKKRTSNKNSDNFNSRSTTRGRDAAYRSREIIFVEKRVDEENGVDND